MATNQPNRSVKFPPKQSANRQPILDSGTDASFRLFIKLREIQAIHDLMLQVKEFSAERQDDWVAENGDLVSNAFEMLIEESHLTFEELSLDESSLYLSRDVINLLRDTLSMVHGILEERISLRS